MGHGADPVKIRNGYSATVNLAYMRRDPACGASGEGGDPWEIRGWRVLGPGGTTSIDNPEEWQWFYIFAEAVDGRLWGGNFLGKVRRTVFRLCRGLGVTGSETVGFLELNTADNDSFRLV